jgi:hypothetical protein
MIIHGFSKNEQTAELLDNGFFIQVPIEKPELETV